MVVRACLLTLLEHCSVWCGWVDGCESMSVNLTGTLLGIVWVG